MRARLAALVLAGAVIAAAAEPANLAELRRAFEHPPDDARILMRWWWFGPAVTQPELEREMRLMKEAGIGGFEVQPVYPLALDDPARALRNLRYLSPEVLDALRFTGQKARELGLRMDLTLGSGWPFGGLHIPITKAAGRLRLEKAGSPTLGDGETRIAAVPDPNGVVWSFIASRTRQMVKRPAVGAEGFVLDPYDRSAVAAHLQAVGEPMLRALAATPPYAIFSDSLEIYNADWTGDLLAEFQKRRGYDLTPDLPALAADIGGKTAAVRHDWGKTLTELAEERYLTPIREWARAHGTRFRSQTYGTPPVALSSNALVDLPEGEGSAWRQFSATRWASSASHLYGKPVTSSETWTWLDSPAFRATPLDLKAEADRHFLQGINQIVGHGWPYSPPAAGEPGWRFYAAAALNEHNPWWIVMPDLALYLQRVSFLLRQGQPVTDVALYLPTDDAWAGFTLGQVSLSEAIGKRVGPDVIPQILDAGYDFDFIDDAAISRVGVRYPLLILPGIERIPLATYRKIEEYARNGGIVVALRRVPSLAPGLSEAETDTRLIQELSRALFEAPGARGRLVPEEAQLGAALRAVRTPDAALPANVGFVHRKLAFADVYFLANTSNLPVHGQAVFRVSGRAARWWDPHGGKVNDAGGSRIELTLAPYESRVLVFSGKAEPNHLAPAGPSPAPIDLSSGWTVTFAGSSQPIVMDRLRSWTEDEARKYFSGLATYERTVNLAPSVIASRRPLFLNFGAGAPVTVESRRSGNGMRALLEGPVREAAVVSVNGKVAGSVWRPPYEVDVTALLHQGPNTIRVVVGNLAINRLARGPLPDYKELNARYGERFQPQDMENLQPLPSGLLGPIRLVAR